MVGMKTLVNVILAITLAFPTAARAPKRVFRQSGDADSPPSAMVESLVDKIGSGQQLTMADLRSFSDSTLSFMPANYTSESEFLAGLIKERQDSLPVVRKLTAAAVNTSRTDAVAAVAAATPFLKNVNKLNFSRDALAAMGEVLAHQLIFNVSAEEAPRVAIAMPKKFVVGLRTFSLHSLIMERFRHESLWTSVDVGTRINWYAQFIHDKTINDFFSETNADAGLLPLLVGATLQDLDQINEQSRIEALLEAGSDVYSPLQLHFLADKFSWKLDQESHRRLRKKLRPYLSLAAINVEFEESADPSDNLSWPLLIKIALLESKMSTVPTVDRFLAVTMTATQLEGYLEDQDATISALNSASSDLLTNGQAAAFLEQQLKAGADHATSGSLVEDSLIVAIPTTYLWDFNDVDETFFEAAIKRFHRLLPSQQMAIFMLISNSKTSMKRKGLNALVKYVKIDADILRFVNPEELKTAQQAGADKSIISDKLLKSAHAQQLPRAWGHALLEMDNTEDVGYEHFKDMNLVNVLTSLTCHELDRVRLLDVHLVLSKYNQLIKANPWRVMPQSVRNCFKQKIMELLTLFAEKGSGKNTPISYLNSDVAKSVGGHVLSAMSLPSMPPKVRDEAMSIIGQLPMSQIVATMSWGRYQLISDLANSHLVSSSTVTTKTMFDVGSLAFVMPKILDGITDVKLFVKAFLIGEHRLVCLPNRIREMWERLLLKSYGHVDKWDEQTIFELGDLLVLLSKANMDRIPAMSLFKAVPHILKGSLLLKHYESTAIHSNATSYSQVCAHWLGDVEGPSYLDSVDNLHRLYARSAQLAVDRASEPKLTLIRGKRRSKRQVDELSRPTEADDTGSTPDAGEEVEDKIAFFFDATSNVLVEMHNKKILPDELMKEVQDIIWQVKNRTADYIQRRLSLEFRPDPLKLDAELQLLQLNNTYMMDSLEERDIEEQMAESGKEMVLEVAKAIQLRPVDIKVTEEVFCSFFVSICEDPTFSPDKSIIFKNVPWYQCLLSLFGGKRRHKRQTEARPIPTAAGDTLSTPNDGEEVVKPEVVGPEQKSLDKTEFFFNATTKVLIKMHDKKILSDKLRKEVEDIIRRVKNHTADYIQRRLKLDSMPDPLNLDAALESLQQNSTYPVGSLEDEDIEKQLAASGKEMTLEVAMAIQLRPVDINVTSEVFCTFYKAICENKNFADETVIFMSLPQKGRTLADGETVSPTLPNIFTCSGIRAAGQAAVAVRKEDMENWNNQEIWQCLEQLGSIEWPLETKIPVWNLIMDMEQLYDSKRKIVPRYAQLLNHLLEAVVLQNPSLLNVTAFNVDVLSAIGRFTYPAEVLESLAQQIKEETPSEYRFGDKEAVELNTIVFGGMGHLACGFLDEDMTSVLSSEEAAKYLLPVFGNLLNHCEDGGALQVMAKRAIDVYGDVSTWSPSLVDSLGIIVSGLVPETFSQFNSAQLASLRPKAIIHLSSEHLSGIPLNHIRHLQPEAVHRMRSDQINELSVEHLEELKQLTEKWSTAHNMISVVQSLQRAEDRSDVEVEPEVAPNKPALSSMSGAGGACPSGLEWTLMALVVLPLVIFMQALN